MPTLAKQIEGHIKNLLKRKKGTIKIQRNQIATHFDCAPSQISYVLQTRFSPEKGYLIESQRGGGGYVQIVEIQVDNDLEMLNAIYKMLKQGISQQQGLDLTNRLQREKIITSRESKIISNIIKRETLSLNLPQRDLIRGKVLQAVIDSLYGMIKGED